MSVYSTDGFFAFLRFWDAPENKQEQSDSELDESDLDDQSSGLTSNSSRTLQKMPAKRDDKPKEKPINPKVFFANERTFLHWMQFCTILGALAIGLVDYGDKIGQIGGLVFSVIASLLMFYALYNYLNRIKRLSKKETGLYDDKVGAVVALLAVFFAVGINFLIRLTSK